MIVKTFVGQDAKEIEERIFQIYGPQAIILTSLELAPGQVEVNFGVEEDEFVAYQKSIKSDPDEDNVEDEFWDEDTIPDVEYIAATTSDILEASIESQISSCALGRGQTNLKNYLTERGLSPALCESIAAQPMNDDQLVEALATHIRCVSKNATFNEQKLLTLSSIEGSDTGPAARKLIRYLQNEGKSVRAALMTDEHTSSQEYDIIHSWDELNDYITNYVYKCDHLVIVTNNTKAFLEQWPSAHIIHEIHACWKPSDISFYLEAYGSHKNCSLTIKGLKISVTPGTIVDGEYPPIRFLDDGDHSIVKADPKDIAKAILECSYAYAENIHHS